MALTALYCISNLLGNLTIRFPTARIVITLTAYIPNEPCQFLSGRYIAIWGTHVEPLTNPENFIFIFIQWSGWKQMQGVPFVYDLFHGEKGL